ncbi:MAG TPA: nucleotide disphospho-sugar-binding domain-containing protein [Steroidobacteraceae bacterium]|nr:nucleotide disphospho-sugar-binding domain-containing protein [Steroidobacteraceae bacterium]
MPSSAAGRRSLRVMLPTLGSAGDVHPFVALGLALRSRGHQATILTNPLFQPLIESQGLGFLPVLTAEDAAVTMADPDLWDARKGFSVVAKRVIIPAIAEVYRLIEAHADSDTVVAASSISFGARLAQERLGLPTATIHLQPIVLLSLIEQGVMGSFRFSAAQPMWLKKALFELVDWATIDRVLKPPLNRFRATLGLPPVSRVLYRWIHSPQCVIAFFPEWFAPPQEDWPPRTHLVGFPLWDGGAQATLAQEVEEFLSAGDAPIIFTAGSAAATMRRFFVESIETARRLKARAMLVTNFPRQLPSELPPEVRAFGYLPFGNVLPRAALLVYHGGIGTMAQTINAGVPHLVVPSSHDQFDNGWRLEQLGLGRAIPRKRFHAGAATRAISEILGDEAIAARCRDYVGRIDSASALTRACKLIEGLAGP